MDNDTWGRIKADWTQFKGHAKAKWGQLTDDEITQIEGQKDQLVGKIQEKYHLAKQDAEKQVEDWVQNLHP
jgi:uncharacterized protein YjbJ (UPF0337 family)